MSVPCSSCGAQIFWCVSATGKSMPLDCRPDPLGLLVLREPEGEIPGLECYEEPMRALHVSALRKAGETVPESAERYTSHFATCPNAARHRKPKS